MAQTARGLVISRLARLADRARESLWVIPSAFVVFALTAAAATQALDGRLPDPVSDALRLYQPSSADGVRAVLSAIATTMIGLAGVGFSITVVTLSLASSQFGPRLLRNFTRDVRNHTVLGVLIGAFVYCLALLVTVRVPSDADFSPPVVGVLTAIAFGLAGLAAFVYFVHHIAAQIQANHVIGIVADDLGHAIERHFPETDEAGARLEPGPWRAALPAGWQAIEVGAPREGHIQVIDTTRLTALAREAGGVAEVLEHPGAFVNAGTPLVVMRSAGAIPAVEAVQACWTIGRDRTVLQDFEFAIHQLVEVAVRALSPGVNDPFTAVTVLDRLGAAYARIGGRALPVNTVRDDDGELRVVLPPVNFGDVLDAGINQIRQNARASAAVSLHLIDVLTRLVPHLSRDDDREAAARQARATADGARRAIEDPIDLASLDARLARFEQALSRGPSRRP